MKILFWTMSVTVLSFYIISYQNISYMRDTTITKMNYALKSAVHDGALNIDESKLSSRIIEFKETEVDKAVIEGLKLNLKVDDTLNPINTNLIKSKITILEKMYLDDRFLYPSCSSFPCMFKYDDTTKNIHLNEPVFGPSVVYVISTKVYGSDEPVQFMTIQEYKK